MQWKHTASPCPKKIKVPLSAQPVSSSLLCTYLLWLLWMWTTILLLCFLIIPVLQSEESDLKSFSQVLSFISKVSYKASSSSHTENCRDWFVGADTFVVQPRSGTKWFPLVRTSQRINWCWENDTLYQHVQHVLKFLPNTKANALVERWEPYFALQDDYVEKYH